MLQMAFTTVCKGKTDSVSLKSSSDFLRTLSEKGISDGRSKFMLWCLMGLSSVNSHSFLI